MAATKTVYGLLFPKYLDPLEVEFQMCRKGGRWTGRNGIEYGEGLFFHFRRAMQLMWPHVVWHKWNNLILEKYCDPAVRTIAILGPASTGKTHTSALCGLTDYFISPGKHDAVGLLDHEGTARTTGLGRDQVACGKPPNGGTNGSPAT